MFTYGISLNLASYLGVRAKSFLSLTPVASCAPIAHSGFFLAALI